MVLVEADREAEEVSIAAEEVEDEVSPEAEGHPEEVAVDLVEGEVVTDVNVMILLFDYNLVPLFVSMGSGVIVECLTKDLNDQHE